MSPVRLLAGNSFFQTDARLNPSPSAGPPSPSLSSTKPLGKGEVGGSDAQGASEASQRPEYFSGKDGEQAKDYNDGQQKAGESKGEHPAEKAAEAAEILNRKANEDKACVPPEALLPWVLR